MCLGHVLDLGPRDTFSILFALILSFEQEWLWNWMASSLLTTYQIFMGRLTMFECEGDKCGGGVLYMDFIYCTYVVVVSIYLYLIFLL